MREKHTYIMLERYDNWKQYRNVNIVKWVHELQLPSHGVYGLPSFQDAILCYGLQAIS